MGDLTKNFSKIEFACKCGCGFDDINPELVFKLQEIRDHFENPIIISSGCRCEIHNKSQGGAPASAHLKGRAADILSVNEKHRFALLKPILQMFDRIGINKRFIHVDIERPPAKGTDIVWLYSSNL